MKALKILTLALVLGLAACSKPAPSEADRTTLRFSIMSTENAQSAQASWAPFLADLEAQTGLKVEPYFGSNYTALIEAMRLSRPIWAGLPISRGLRPPAGPMARSLPGPPSPRGRMAISR